MLKALLGNTINGFAKDLRGWRARANVHPTWESAAAGAAYEDPDLIEFRARNSEILVRRDSGRAGGTPGLNYLRLCALQVQDQSGPVHVVDFGGSFGDEGVMLVGDDRFVGATYTVCETPAVVARARGIVFPPGIAFVSDLAAIGRCDIFFSSGALAYVRDHAPILEAAAGLRPAFIILVRNSFSEREIIRLQESRLFDNVPPARAQGGFENRRVRYPHRTINQEAVVGLLAGRGYDLVASFAEQSGVYPYGDRVYGRDLIFLDRDRPRGRVGRA